MSCFIHLHLHTEYSLVDGLVRIKPLVKQVRELGMPACAMTDQSNLFALVKFYRAAQGAGIKPLIGVDLWVLDEKERSSRLVLLCMDELGYRNLTRLVSASYQKGQKLGRAYVRKEWLSQDNLQGLIGLSGGREGDIGQALLNGNRAGAEQMLAFWQEVLPERFYLELQRTGRPGEEDYIHAAVELAQARSVPVTASNDVMFLHAEDFDAHEVRVCIHDGYTLDDGSRPQRYTEQQYLRSPEEMAELFSDIPEAIENTWHIAQRCNLELTLGKNFLPLFPVPEGMTTAEYFCSEAKKGLEERLDFLFGEDKAAKRAPYDERLQIELDVIVSMDFPGYFLIVADFIQWAKNNAIPVGPGRGSGAGSLVAYALKITDLDPLAYDLLFERFLNPERVSMPDFDVDFCMEGRDRVIDYVARHYGREKVSQIITYGSMAAKAVVRDVGRVLGHPYGFVDQIAKLIPFDLGITLDKALEQEEALRKRYQEEEEVRDLLDMARKLEGLTRNVGKHAGGVVIAPSELTDFSPLYCEEDGSNLVTQFDKGDVEDAGLVKFDFLGLRTLTIIDWALQTVNRNAAEPVDIARIPLADPATFKLLKSGQTTAVFQLESRGMQELIKRLKPDCFEDIVALVALFRPGPLQSGMVDDFINRKHGKAKVEYPHPDLEPILKPTYGVILYQEQVMQIAQVLAGYTLGGADLLRRAMGKKKPEEMAKQRTIFTDGATERGVEEKTATYIFDLMEKFAGYGFNKSVDSQTKVYTINGIKSIKDCQAGDKVLSRTPTGKSVYSTVVALHDHGLTPLWEIEFDDGTVERCTLDHKWLTEYGQQPLWKILQMGSAVWGCAAYPAGDESPSENLSSLRGQQADISLGNQMRHGGAPQARYSRASETMPGVHEHDPHGAFGGQSTDDVLWRGGDNAQSRQRAFSAVREMSENPPRHSRANWQGFGAYAGNAHEIFSDSKENLSTSRDTNRTRTTPKNMARQPSRGISSDSGQSTGFAQTLKNGSMVRTASSSTGFYPQYTNQVSTRAQANRLCASSKENRHRSGWPLAFSSHQLRRILADGTSSRSPIGSGDPTSILALNSAFDGMFQQWIWRAYLSRTDATPGCHQRWQLGRDTVLRQPVRATFLGWHQSYDLEVDHPEHNFLLASGLCCSNSHSAAYALVSYQTAWLKWHYPEAFMAAVMSSDMDNTEKVVGFIDECRQMKLDILPPQVNYSDYKFTVAPEQKRAIHYGLGAIKGAGEAALEAIVQERKTNGAYTDLFDFCRRIDLRKCNRRVLEALLKAGGLDDLGPDRGVMMASLDTALKMAEQHAQDQAAGQTDMFGLLAAPPTPEQNASDSLPYAQVRPWTEAQRLAGEKETLGLYLTGHPIEAFLKELGHYTKRLSQIKPTGRGQTVKVAGLVYDMRTINSKRGRMGALTLDDRSGRLEAVLYADLYETYKDKLAKDKILVVEGEVSEDNYNGGYSMSVQQLWELGEAREVHVKQLRLRAAASQFENGLVKSLQAALDDYRGGKCPVIMNYQNQTASISLRFGQDWKIRPDEELLYQLRQLLGEDSVSLEY